MQAIARNERATAFLLKSVCCPDSGMGIIIEYDIEDRCIRVNDVAVSHADAERFMSMKPQQRPSKTPLCNMNAITPQQTTPTGIMTTDLEPELIDALKILGWEEF